MLYDATTETHRKAARSAPPVVTVAPTEEPVSLIEAKRHCKCEDSGEDLLFTDWIKTAREEVEFDADVAIVTQTRKQYLDYFPDGPIELRSPPVQSVSSVTYTDTSGSVQTLSASLYQTDLTSRPGLILPTYAESCWPECQPGLHSITVTYICGYGAAAAAPLRAKQAMYLKIASYYRNREMTKQETMAYDSLIRKLRWRGEL